MKMKNKIIIVAGLLFSLLTNAQTLVFSTVNVNVGTATADVTVTWDNQGAVPTAVNFNASYTFNAAGIQFVSCATALNTCAETAPGSGAISIGGFGSPANGVVATLTFNTSSAAAASYPILPGVPAPNFSPGGQAIAVTNGAINVVVVSPQYTSVVSPGTAIALGSILQGGANPASSIDITNTGDVGTTLTGTCTSAAPFIVTGGAFSVAQGAAAATVGVECDATAAPMVYNGTLSCAHDGSNIPSPATYPLSCEVLPATAVGSQSPPGGTALNVVVAPSGTNTTTITFSESGGQGVAITDLDCVLTPGVGFSILSPLVFPATVPAAGNLDVVVQFTDPGDGSATNGFLECTYSDRNGVQNANYDLNFIIRAVNVPTLSMMGYIALTLGFGLIGFFAFRRRA